MTELRLTLFGVPRLKRAGTLVEIDTRKALALLAYLALNHQEHSREALAALFWPEQNEASARRSLRRTLWSLRQALASASIEGDKQTVIFRPSPSLIVDVLQFQALIAAAARAPDDQLGEHVEKLQAAVALYRADFLAGFTLPDCPGFDEWHFFTAERLRRMLADGLQRLMRWCTTGQNYAAGIDYARRWLALDPLHEPAHRTLMQLYAWADQPSAALRQYEECTRLLKEELGVPPEEETTQLYTAIRTKRAPPPAMATRASAVSVAPPAPPVPVRHNFSMRLTPLLGRALELHELDLLMFDRGERLITITGPGGMGKTALALAAAERCLAAGRFRDGVFVVPLAAINTVPAILPELMTALALPPERGQGSEATLKRQVFDYLHTRQLLLLFDNFEQVLEGGGLLIDLLAAAQNVHILVTSRERLHLREEQVYPIGGLECPATVADRAAPALALFLRTARRVQPHFEPSDEDRRHLVRICQLVGGIPLALELAASWVNLLPLATIVAEIEANLDLLETAVRDVPARQRSIRIVFDTTWKLLSADECRLFAQLSVFRGGFTREAARHVTGATVKQLSTLADKSLIEYRHNSDRYELHDLLRQFAEEKLVETGEQATIEYRHLEFFVQLAEEAEPKLTTLEQRQWLLRLEHEHANLHSALTRSLACQWYDLAVRLGGALSRFWFIRGDVHGGREFLGRIRTALADPQTAPVDAAKMYSGLGWLAYLQGEYTQAVVEFEQALALARRAKDARVIARVLRGLALQAHNQGERARAEALAQESLEVAHAAGDDMLAGAALNVLGELARTAGEYTTAAALLAESQRLLQRAGDSFGRVYAQNNAGWVAQALGDYAYAKAMHQEALTLASALGDVRAIAFSLEAVASVLVHSSQTNRVEWAARLLGAAEALRTRVNIPLEEVDRPDYENCLAAARTALDNEAFLAAWTAGQAMTLERAVAHALTDEE